MSSTQTIAFTIFEQLGGSRFGAMTGAKGLVDLNDGLQFKIGRGASRGINTVRVVLDPSDTYNVTFYRIAKRGLDVREVAQAEGIYADMLREVFTRETGFDCTL